MGVVSYPHIPERHVEKPHVLLIEDGRHLDAHWMDTAPHPK